MDSWRACLMSTGVKEALRLYPAVVQETVRQAKVDTELGGYRTRKGDAVSSQIYQMHHDEELWGSDVNEFKPERWKQGPPILRLSRHSAAGQGSASACDSPSWKGSPSSLYCSNLSTWRHSTPTGHCAITTQARLPSRAVYRCGSRGRGLQPDFVVSQGLFPDTACIQLTCRLDQHVNERWRASNHEAASQYAFVHRTHIVLRLRRLDQGQYACVCVCVFFDSCVPGCQHSLC